MLRKYPLECLASAAAVFGLFAWWLSRALPSIEAWWSQHWLLLVFVSGVVLVGGTAHKWVPLIWRAYVAITDHADTKRIREQHYLMLASTNTKLEQGFDTNYKNAVHGFEISVHNPYMKGVTKIQEVPAGQIAAPIFPQPRDFAEILGSFVPNENGIYLLDTMKGPVTSPMNRICHVALGGPTGGGKTGCTRLLTSQILSCEGTVYMANPNFAPVKLNVNRLEDWRPIAARLKEPVARELDEIIELFERFIQLFEQRRAQEQQSPRRGKDVFLVVGEWPAIVSKATLTQGKKTAERLTGQLGRLLRESRQYGIHIISEFQDALVSTIGGNSGVRENYRTAYYFGGDLNTAKVLLDLQNGVKIEDTGLGDKGAAYLRAHSNGVCPGRVPFFSNRALYMLLGTPEDPVSDDFVTSMEQVPDQFMPFVESNRITGELTGLPNFKKWIDASSNDESLSEISALPEESINEPGEKLQEDADEMPELGTDDYILSDLQIELFSAYYRDCGNISESLARIKNERGQGLGRRYFKHASWIVKQKNLRRSN